MRQRILAVGKPALPYARDGIAEYARRLDRSGRGVELVYLRDGPPDRVEAALLRASEGTHRVVLDERGERLDTHGFAERFARWERDAVRSVSFLIGGADGHSDSLRNHADTLLSLSPLTLQHELALVVLLEQLYRVQSLRRGEPYHR